MASRRGKKDESEREAAVTVSEGVTTRRSYSLMDKHRHTVAETVPREIESRTVVLGEGEEADHRRVGGRNKQTEAEEDKSDDEPEAEDDDRSDGRSEQSVHESEASDDWLESRSRIITPESSTPPSPRRRTSVEDPAPRRHADLTVSAPPSNQPNPLSGRLRAAPGHRQSSLPIQELEDPATLEARSSQLISHLQRFIQERERELPSPTNEPLIRGDRPASGGTEAGRGGRHGLQVPQLFGAVAAKPGRCETELARTEAAADSASFRVRGEPEIRNHRADQLFSDSTINQLLNKANKIFKKIKNRQLLAYTICIIAGAAIFEATC